MDCYRCSCSILVCLLSRFSVTVSITPCYLFCRSTGAPFGIPWIGKAYFALCVATTLGISRYWNLFQPDSTSWHLMHYSIKGCGLTLLYFGTSWRFLRFILLGTGLFYDHLIYLSWYSYLFITARLQTPTYRYIGKKVCCNYIYSQ